MNGVRFSTPTTLAEALAPMADICAKLDWAISLYSGPFSQIHHADEDDNRNLLHLYHDLSSNGAAWFRRGILPTHADDLIFDEWSYYFGFDSATLPPSEACSYLKGELSITREVFELAQRNDCLFLMFIDDGWWEAYTGIDGLQSLFMTTWAGQLVESTRLLDRSYWIDPHGEKAK